MRLDVSSLAHIVLPRNTGDRSSTEKSNRIPDKCSASCEYKGVEIIEAEACKDHIHMLVSIPPKYSVAQIMGYLKGKSSLIWCGGYYVSTVGRDRRAIEQYIRNQLQEDISADQMSISEYIDPFTGTPATGLAP